MNRTPGAGVRRTRPGPDGLGRGRATWPRWGRPSSSAASAAGIPAGATSLYGDGSVRFLKSSVSPKVYQHLANRADGEVIDCGPVLSTEVRSVRSPA